LKIVCFGFGGKITCSYKGKKDSEQLRVSIDEQGRGLRFRDGVGDLGEERLGASRIENLLRGLDELASPIIMLESDLG